jgi:hypothetical protein
MPIKMVIRRIKGEDVYCPEFWCDHCGKRIARAGNYEYPTFSGAVGTSVDRVFYTHKGCSTNFRAARGGQRKFMWDELKVMPRQLANNLKAKES